MGAILLPSRGGGRREIGEAPTTPDGYAPTRMDRRELLHVSALCRAASLAGTAGCAPVAVEDGEVSRAYAGVRAPALVFEGIQVAGL